MGDGVSFGIAHTVVHHAASAFDAGNVVQTVAKTVGSKVARTLFVPFLRIKLLAVPEKKIYDFFYKYRHVLSKSM